MKKKIAIILAGMLLAITHTVFAEQSVVLMEFHRKINPEKNMNVNRAPMRQSIEVIYDSETHEIKVVGDEAIEAEVFLYKKNGTLENYSSVLNTGFTVLTSGTYIIQIQGTGWYAEGVFEV